MQTTVIQWLPVVIMHSDMSVLIIITVNVCWTKKPIILIANYRIANCSAIAAEKNNLHLNIILTLTRGTLIILSCNIICSKMLPRGLTVVATISTTITPTIQNAAEEN